MYRSSPMMMVCPIWLLINLTLADNGYSPIRTAGYDIAQILHHEIEQKSKTKTLTQRVLEVDLVIRGSTRPRRQ